MRMVEWGPLAMAAALFIVLSPGLLFQILARTRLVELGSMCTSGISVLVHAAIFFTLLLVLDLVFPAVHVGTGC